ncbi:MAG: dihydrodipicolinate synthase family protein [Acidobacteria bacterium]|nr:dihydrodipicolinate synthase family protein [Acidobacteriota bacterium]
MKIYRGLFPPLITPFDEQNRVDERGLRDHVDFVIASGVDGMCAGSSTGEFMNLTREEWEGVLHVTMDQANKRVPIFAGTADLSTPAAVERSRFAERMGFDGLLIISPWYQVHTQRELYAHFKAIRDAVSIPIMIYNNPPVTGVQLSVPLLERMANDGIVQYLKDADSDPFAISRLKMRVGDKLQLFYGHDNNAIGAFAFGATGWVSGSANFDPKRWADFIHACINDNDFVRGREIWYEMLPFVELVTVGENDERPDWIAVIKRGLELRGHRAGSVRPPMLPLSAELNRKVEQAVAAMTF